MEDKNTNIISKQANPDQNTSIYWWNHTCKFLALSTVWAGVLQQVSEEMLVPKTEREGLFHKKTPEQQYLLLVTVLLTTPHQEREY